MVMLAVKAVRVCWVALVVVLNHKPHILLGGIVNMGYYTAYTLMFDISKVNAIEELQDEIRNMNVFDSVECIGTEDGVLFAYDKWYDCEKDMTLLSSRFPDILFELYGKGEDDEDIWVQYFKGGKTQYCGGRVVYDDYDERKLENRHVVGDESRYSYQSG